MSDQLDIVPCREPEAFGLRGVAWTDTQLSIAVELSYADWETLVVGLFRAERAVAFAIGDALVYGERVYGEAFFQVEATLDRLGLRRSPDTFRKYAWVSRQVLPSRRRDDLSFTSHQEVARLEPAVQVEMLSLAAENRWSSRDLRAHVREAFPPADPERSRLVEVEADRLERLERTEALVRQAVKRGLPGRDGTVCIPADLFGWLAAAVAGGTA